MFKRDPEKAAAAATRREEKRQVKDQAVTQRKIEKDDLKDWRRGHPAEQTLNLAAMLKAWPSSKYGETSLGPILGGQAEFVNAGAHKGWTATRLVAGAVTLGASAAATGRKNKGAAVINVTFGNGAAQTYGVRPDASVLKAANQYVNAFNALAAQMASEAGQG